MGRGTLIKGGIRAAVKETLLEAVDDQFEYQYDGNKLFVRDRESGKVFSLRVELLEESRNQWVSYDPATEEG